MSVAFRREADDEHLEPKFERPIPPGPNLVTARGLKQIRDRVAELETRLRELDDAVAIEAAKRDLRYWSTRQSTAQLMDPVDGSRVAFGCMVTFRMNGVERAITTVGDDEADPVAGLLSFSAPLSRALMGAEPGEMLDFANIQGAIEVLRVTTPDE